MPTVKTFTVAALAIALLAATIPRATAATPPDSDPIWQNFTYTPFTYRQAMDPVGSAETESAAECAALCGAEQACDTYAWCPDTAVQGRCASVWDDASPSGGGNYTAMSCHLGASWDEASATYNYQITEGRSLEWVSGTRLARDQLPGNSCNLINNTMYNPVWSQVGEALKTLRTVPSAEACCARCQETDGCAVFLYCDPEAENCYSIVYPDGSVEPISGYPSMSNGECGLYSVPDVPNMLANHVIAESQYLDFVSGYLG